MPDKKSATPKTSSLEARVKALEERLPRTQLLDQSFLKRALAVYGHYFVINLIIGAIISVITMVFVFVPILIIAITQNW